MDNEYKVIKTHIVEAYDYEISQLEAMVHKIICNALEQLRKLHQVFQKNKTQLASEILIFDQSINALNDSIENRVVQAIALWQPLADDLRNILYSMKIAADIERMADHIKNVAKLYLKHTVDIIKCHHLVHGISCMIDSLITMLENVLAFKKQDKSKIARLYDVCNQDHIIDDAFNHLFKYLIELMDKTDPKMDIDVCMSLLFITKNLERVGDLIVSITQHFYYIITAQKINN